MYCLREVIQKGEDNVETIHWQKTGDKIKTDVRPGMCGNREGLKVISKRLAGGFGTGPNVTSRYNLAGVTTRARLQRKIDLGKLFGEGVQLSILGTRMVGKMKVGGLE